MDTVSVEEMIFGRENINRWKNEINIVIETLQGLTSGLDRHSSYSFCAIHENKIHWWVAFEGGKFSVLCKYRDDIGDQFIFQYPKMKAETIPLEWVEPVRISTEAFQHGMVVQLPWLQKKLKIFQKAAQSKI